MVDMNDFQIDLMNMYVRKQEDFTLELLRRFLETQAKLELSDNNAKNNAGMITELVQNNANSLKELGKKHDDELQQIKSRNEILERDYSVLNNNYTLTKQELEKALQRIIELNQIEDKYREIYPLYQDATKELESLQRLNNKKIKPIKKEGGTTNGPLE